jgi:hypothetical protein
LSNKIGPDNWEHEGGIERLAIGADERVMKEVFKVNQVWENTACRMDAKGETLL